MEDIFDTIEIEINHGCNRSCSYCPNSQEERVEKGQMENSLYKKIISDLKIINFKGKMSFHFYNEPMLSPNLRKFVELAKNSLPEISIELYSNGTLLTVEKFRQLKESGVNKFIITKHENIVDYEFEKTLQNLSKKELLSTKYIHFNELRLTNRGGVLKHISPEITTALLPCHLPKQMLTVTVKGNVVPCFEDFYQKNQMGNVLESSLLDIWNSKKYVAFRNSLDKGLRHKFEACKDCNRLEVL